MTLCIQLEMTLIAWVQVAWSDVRYIDHVEVQKGEFITLFTTEHRLLQLV